ncbi:hypothetical protein JX265_007051 [Neoarthrinium moseri]|uniref:Uncharacterized protein n=1 Tax=Neoarthrinium moseri TaxID=1658444 RepID=A0A9Q0APR4_9PEZI|nr:uncharacterized protein JN550_008001 [Neoarthrinium moseri]KAI1844691.1 hypothetical protein JX266_009147 [Neoarthrinium moseri]KAI1866023.1 hypothetical protein JN550_008001 [Neoarthrinium moseri]KAI1868228.1 hypothetical protein JX265_007051 [Neoarthrinium moseri]
MSVVGDAYCFACASRPHPVSFAARQNHTSRIAQRPCWCLCLCPGVLSPFNPACTSFSTSVLVANPDGPPYAIGLGTTLEADNEPDSPLNVRLPTPFYPALERHSTPSTLDDPASPLPTGQRPCLEPICGRHSTSRRDALPAPAGTHLEVWHDACCPATPSPDRHYGES